MTEVKISCNNQRNNLPTQLTVTENETTVFNVQSLDTFLRTVHCFDVDHDHFRGTKEPSRGVRADTACDVEEPSCFWCRVPAEEHVETVRPLPVRKRPVDGPDARAHRASAARAAVLVEPRSERAPRSRREADLPPVRVPRQLQMRRMPHELRCSVRAVRDHHTAVRQSPCSCCSCCASYPDGHAWRVDAPCIFWYSNRMQRCRRQGCRRCILWGERGIGAKVARSCDVTETDDLEVRERAHDGVVEDGDACGVEGVHEGCARAREELVVVAEDGPDAAARAELREVAVCELACAPTVAVDEVAAEQHDISVCCICSVDCALHQCAWGTRKGAARRRRAARRAVEVDVGQEHNAHVVCC